MSDWYPKSAPRPVDGGVRARSRRGAIAQTWWSERFIGVLESIGLGGRLARGRTYARKGQVVGFHLDAGTVTATVQGTRIRPYRLRVGLQAFGKSQWAHVSQALADNAWYAAKLLAGEMPEDIEEVFASVGLSLFPVRGDEISMDCSCPDWEVPCKHLAALFYVLAESFDDDPFGILALRGRTREDLLGALSALRTGGVAADRAEEVERGAPLDRLLDSYFDLQAGLEPRNPPRLAVDSVLDQVAPVELTVRGRNLTQILRPFYLTLDQGDPTAD